jgi:hypothetical protein
MSKLYNTSLLGIYLNSLTSNDPVSTCLRRHTLHVPSPVTTRLHHTHGGLSKQRRPHHRHSRNNYNVTITNKQSMTDQSSNTTDHQRAPIRTHPHSPSSNRLTHASLQNHLAKTRPQLARRDGNESRKRMSSARRRPCM